VGLLQKKWLLFAIGWLLAFGFWASCCSSSTAQGCESNHMQLNSGPFAPFFVGFQDRFLYLIGSEGKILRNYVASQNQLVALV
jgi:hypothetical protein